MGSAYCRVNVDSAHHIDHLRVYSLSNNSSLGGNIFQHFVKSGSFDLLPPQLRTSVIEIEEYRTLVELSDEELWPVVDGYLCTE